MPARRKGNHTSMLVQVARELHAAADARRRTERLTWDRVISTLLARWIAGADDSSLGASVRQPRRPAAGHAVKPEPSADTLRVDPASIEWHGSLAQLFRAEAKKRGRLLPADALETLDVEDVEGSKSASVP